MPFVVKKLFGHPLIVMRENAIAHGDSGAILLRDIAFPGFGMLIFQADIEKILSLLFPR